MGALHQPALFSFLQLAIILLLSIQSSFGSRLVSHLPSLAFRSRASFTTSVSKWDRLAVVHSGKAQHSQQQHQPRSILSCAPLSSRVAWCAPIRRYHLRSVSGGEGGSNPPMSDVDNKPPPNHTLWNLPNILTMVRVLGIPLLVFFFYLHTTWRNAACSGLFIFASFTDWLDGYLARKMNLTSPLGAFLDPVADKLMVATALVLMVDRLSSCVVTTCTAIIVCREIGVSALREWMASRGQRDTVAVGWWGKVKTATQMASLSILLLVQPPYPATAIYQNLYISGIVLLIISTILTITSAAGYVRAAWPALSGAV